MLTAELGTNAVASAQLHGDAVAVVLWRFLTLEHLLLCHAAWRAAGSSKDYVAVAPRGLQELVVVVVVTTGEAAAVPSVARNAERGLVVHRRKPPPPLLCVEGLADGEAEFSGVVCRCCVRSRCPRNQNLTCTHQCTSAGRSSGRSTTTSCWTSS